MTSTCSMETVVISCFIEKPAVRSSANSSSLFQKDTYA